MSVATPTAVAQDHAVLVLGGLRIPRNTLFWGLHAAGWTAYGCAQYLGALLYDKEPG